MTILVASRISKQKLNVHVSKVFADGSIKLLPDQTHSRKSNTKL